MLVKHLKFLEIEVTLLELHSFTCILLYQTLSLFLDLKICEARLFCIHQIASNFGLFSPE